MFKFKSGGKYCLILCKDLTVGPYVKKCKEQQKQKHQQNANDKANTCCCIYVCTCVCVCDFYVMCLYAWRKIRPYFAQIRSYVGPHVKETHIKIQPLTAISGYVGNVNTRFLRAVYVCICPGQSNTGSIVEAIEN